MDMDSLCNKLMNRLAEPLPGMEIQKSMLPKLRNSNEYNRVPNTALKAAVLLLLMTPRETEQKTSVSSALIKTVIPLIQRVENGQVHSGQIALPGGVKEGQEPFPVGTALREAEEEIGLMTANDRILILGPLTPLYIPVSNFGMYPVVACTDQDHSLFPQLKEVSRIIYISVEELLKVIPAEKKFISRGIPVKAPCYQVGGVEIWGATAMVLSEFLWICTKVIEDN